MTLHIPSVDSMLPSLNFPLGFTPPPRCLWAQAAATRGQSVCSIAMLLRNTCTAPPPPIRRPSAGPPVCPVSGAWQEHAATIPGSAARCRAVGGLGPWSGLRLFISMRIGVQANTRGRYGLCLPQVVARRDPRVRMTPHDGKVYLLVACLSY